ncbi:hypothetical protein VTH06DRAFT_1111 [Thermothelomyces fergusii]
MLSPVAPSRSQKLPWPGADRQATGNWQSCLSQACTPSLEVSSSVAQPQRAVSLRARGGMGDENPQGGLLGNPYNFLSSRSPLFS